jgi:hypothetical protein
VSALFRLVVVCGQVYAAFHHDLVSILVLAVAFAFAPNLFRRRIVAVNYGAALEQYADIVGDRVYERVAERVDARR